MMLERDRIEYYFSLTHELPELEFKGPGRRGDNPLFGRVVRGAMALSNRRGGGTIIIGISETDTGFRFDGLTPEQLVTWKNDEIGKGFNAYTSTPIVFDRQEYEHEGKTFLVLHIHEFTSVPVMCLQDYRDRTNPKDLTKFVLHKSWFYIRTLNMPESREIRTSDEVRLLAELVASKGVETFVRQAKSGGLDIAPRKQDEALFAQQLQDWKGPLSNDIHSRGYWTICIRPMIFQQERVALHRLEPLITNATVHYRNSSFPFLIPQQLKTGQDWIGSEVQFEWLLQTWRFFQSGQFTAEIGFLDDWADKLSHPFQKYSTNRELLLIQEVVFRLTEVFGFTARLVTTDIYRDEHSVVIDVTLHNVQNRQLSGQRLYQTAQLRYTADVPNITYRGVLAKEDIIARPHELACTAAAYIFERFQWNPSLDLLATIQSEALTS